MQDERGRNRVEQLRIVDADHHRTAPGARAQLLTAASHQRDDVVGADLVGHQIGDGREGHRRRAARRLHPVDERAVALRRGLRLPGQARLPHPGVGDEDHTMAPRARSRRRDRLEFAIAADERPRARQRGRSAPGPQAYATTKLYALDKSAFINRGDRDYTNRSSQSETRVFARRAREPARRPAAREHSSSAWTAHSGSDPALAADEHRRA